MDCAVAPRPKPQSSPTGHGVVPAPIVLAPSLSHSSNVRVPGPPSIARMMARANARVASPRLKKGAHVPLRRRRKRRLAISLTSLDIADSVSPVRDPRRERVWGGGAGSVGTNVFLSKRP